MKARQSNWPGFVVEAAVEALKAASGEYQQAIVGGKMAQPLASVVARLTADPAMVRAFTQAFPESPQVNGANLAKAIATYERTFVSPETRFDRWIAGDEHALTPREVAGFRLFTGKAGCIKCHSGFAFTDYAFYDIGLPGDDRGRGAVLRLPAVEHAFKTPS